MGEIQEVHDCTLLENKLAFIVTLRATNAIAKVYKNDINTNSLRHAVPFSNVCNKYGVKTVDDLEKKLIKQFSSSSSSSNNKNGNNNNTNPPNTNRDRSTNTKGGIIEISCDSNTSLKQLKNIANVVNKTAQQSPQINSIPSRNKQSVDIEIEGSDDNDSEYQQDTATTSQSPEKITYNLRSRKRTFGELNHENTTHKIKPQQPPKPCKPKDGMDRMNNIIINKDIVDLTPNESDGDDDTASINNVHNTNNSNSNNKNIGNNNKRIKVRPKFLRPIPNSTHIGPLSSPTKVMNNLRKLNIDSNKYKTSSAPNTPILNGNKRSSSSASLSSQSQSRPSTPIINLVNSPQVPAPLQFPQISLPQGQFTLLGPLKFPSHPTTTNGLTSNGSITNGNTQRLNRINTVNTNRLNGVNGLSANSLAQLQQLIMLQKRMSETNFNKQSIQQPLPRLESENDEKLSSSNTNTTDGGSNASVQLIEDDINSNNNNNNNNNNAKIQEPPTKKQKLLNGTAKHKNKSNNNDNKNGNKLSAQTLGEQFWSERLLSVFLYFLIMLQTPEILGCL